MIGQTMADAACATQQMGEIVCRFQTLDGTSKAFYIDSATTVTEALHELCKKIGLRDPRGWAVFITYNNISRGLGEKERLAGTSLSLCVCPWCHLK